MNACYETWAVEAHKVAASELGVATDIELRIDGCSSHGADCILAPDGFAIVVRYLQLFNNGNLGRGSGGRLGCCRGRCRRGKS